MLKSFITPPKTQDSIGFMIWFNNNSRVPFTFLGLAYQGKDIVFTFIIEYSSLKDFGP
jgi:hypothetical protein